HPPIWVAAVSPETFARFGRMGYPFLSSPNFTPLQYVKEQYASYREEYLAAGHPPAQLELPLLQQVYVAPTAERARQEPERYAMWYFRTLAEVAASPGQAPADYRFYGKIADRLRSVGYDEIYEHGATFGTPESCVERIQMYQQEIGLNYFLCWMNFGGLPHAQVRAAMRLFAEKVMPAFR
ncbi:MAG: LLM class flavin-dependent oxidoreductase, partial [Chloroflexi bacterium]|nr:LLM class flavin-dependent oxidoreductase [Chloroflexota bacterium]